jgi:hypothetical protein
MVDKTEPFYSPEGVQAEPEKRKPGRPPKAVAHPALEIDRDLTADHSLAPDSTPHEGESLEDAIARIRAIRKPFGGAMQQKLALPERQGYHRHWFNDVAGRIDEASASGWSHIMNPRDGKTLKRAVGSGRDNGVLYAYAMELPNVFWQEEMDARHAKATAQIDAIKTKPFQAKPGQAQASDKGKFYDPTEGSGKGPISVTKG